jgi:two-component system cell cycle response regulator
MTPEETTVGGAVTEGFLETALTHEMARCRRHGVMASLVVAQLDDPNGASDAIERAVFDVIRRHVRAADILCRCGDRQVAIVLPDTYPSGAMLVGERIVTEVRHGRIAWTVSVGVASYGSMSNTHAGLVDAAERALAEAKAAGGDRVGPCRACAPFAGLTSSDAAASCCVGYATVRTGHMTNAGASIP